MRATGTFTVEAFTPIDVDMRDAPRTETPVAVAKMQKRFEGEVGGSSTTIFTYAMNAATDVGGYVATESFRGVLHDRTGTFNFMHAATTSGNDRADDFLVIVPSSGTGDLEGISGSGGIIVEPTGAHRIWFEYAFADSPTD